MIYPVENAQPRRVLIARLTGDSAASSACLDFAEEAGDDVVDEAARGDVFGNPGMRAEFLQLLADVPLNVVEGVEMRRGDGGGSGTILDHRAQLLLALVEQSAVGVVDHHELFGAEQIVRDEQRPQAIVCDDAARVADDVGIAGFQAHGANREPRVHTSEDGELALGPRR